MKAVQRMLGHASAAMTLDVYADLFEDDLDAVADALSSQAITQSVGSGGRLSRTVTLQKCENPRRTGGFLLWLRPVSIR